MTPLPWYQQQRIVHQILLSLALAIAAVWIYLPVRHYGFLNLDDGRFVTANPNIQGGLSWQSAHWALTAGFTHTVPNTDYWRPLSYLSHAADIEFFGLNPTGHHLMNVGLHALTAVALFLVLQSMTNAPWRCAFVAALFALHPLRVESVAWISERKDVLSGLFFMLTLGAYTRYVWGPFSLRWYLAVFFLFACALMSKPMVATLPFVLLLLDYWPLRRTRWVPSVVPDTTVTLSPSRLLKEKLPLVALAAASTVITYLGHRTVTGINLDRTGFGTRIANALLSYVSYIGKTFWPTRLAVWYPRSDNLSATAAIAAGATLVAITVAVMWQARRRPWLVMGWCWYLGMLLPVIGLLQGSGEAMADRFTYLPSIGLFVMLCWSVPSRALESWNLKVLTAVGAAVVLALCAATSRAQLAYWKDEELLLRHTLDVTRDNWLAECSLGVVLEQAGRLPEAIEHLQASLRISPEYAEAHYNLGLILCQLGKTQEGIEHYQEALRIKPDFFEARCNLGIALWQTGRTMDAVDQYQQALQIQPDFAQAHYNLGIALAQVGRMPESIDHLEQAVRLSPNYADAQYNLGVALAQTGKMEEAIDHFQQALRIKPDFAEAHCNLGIALAQVGRRPEAIQHLEQALRLKPDLTPAQNALAQLQHRQ